MSRGYNELVGLQARFSRVIPRYSLTHLYRWKNKGVMSDTGTLRGYDMQRHAPIETLIRSLGEAYGPAVLSIWRQRTRACIVMFFQFEVGNEPKDLDLAGEWEHWAQL